MGIKGPLIDIPEALEQTVVAPDQLCVRFTRLRCAGLFQVFSKAVEDKEVCFRLYTRNICYLCDATLHAENLQFIFTHIYKYLKKKHKKDDQTIVRLIA